MAQWQTTTTTTRQATLDDLPSIMMIQRACYSDSLQEDAETMAGFIRAYDGEWCLVATVGGKVVGYALAHPWQAVLGVPQLTEPVRVLTDSTFIDTLFIHDVAVLPAYRNHKLATAMAERLIAKAKAEVAATTLMLVAIDRARTYWERFGFQVVAECSDTSSYEGSAGDNHEAVVMKLFIGKSA